jgi:hypothetical protein
VGVERAVTRWYLRRQEIQRDIDALQTRLEQPHPEEDKTSSERAEIEQQLSEARARLLSLGPCPKPIMG